MNSSKEFFKENCDLFASPVSEPEKYNLYGGLFNLSKEIEELTRLLHQIQREIRANR